MTELLMDKRPCVGYEDWCEGTNRCKNYSLWIHECLNKLEKYEAAKEEGKLVILPCKPGDTVYIIRDDCDFPYDCYQSRTCNKCEYRNIYVDEEVFSLADIVINLRLFGITIFLIREQAEKALEKLKDV